MANQMEPASFNVDSAAQSMISSGLIGRILGEPDDEPEQEEPEDSYEPETVDEEPQEAEASDQTDEGDEQSDTENEPDESVTLETLDDVAQALGVDPNQLLDNLKMRIKVNGEERLITLSEAQKGNQFEQDYRHKTAALAEERRSHEAERLNQLQQMQQAATETAAALQFTEWLISQEANSPAMQELRQSNPAEWVARNQEFQQKFQGLNAARQQAQQQYAQLLAQNNAQKQQQIALMLQEQEAHLKSKVQDWTDDKKVGVAKFLKEQYGWSDEDLGNVYDHRLILMALDAQKGASTKTEEAKVIKKVTALPKLQKPGKSTGPIQVKARHLAGLKSQATKTGKVRDAAKVIEALMR